MRGSVLQTGEDYKAYYYDIVYDEMDIEKGKPKMKISDKPQEFFYKTTTISGSAVFTSSKGYETKPQIIGGTMITESQIYRIQTSTSDIKFKNGGLVKMLVDNVWKSFTIQKITRLTSGPYTFSANRLGYFDTSKVPVVLELR